MQSIDKDKRTLASLFVIVISLVIFLGVCAKCLGLSVSMSSFNGGQAGPHMEPRFDYKNYRALNRTMENMLPTVHGPVQRRPGTYYVAQAATALSPIPERPASDPTKIGITTAAGLQAMEDDLTEDYELRADIDLSGVAWVPIAGSNAGSVFEGSFDGRYYTISNLTIIADDAGKAYTGLFGKCSGAQISNTIITNASITIPDDALNVEGIGFLSGDVSGSTSTVTNCYASGTMTITEDSASVGMVGGLIGDASVDISVVRCGADIIINRTNFNIRRVGSLVGRIISPGAGGATIIDSYGKCTLTATGLEISTAGGLLGWGDKVTITNCYSSIVFVGTDTSNNGGFIGFDGAGVGTELTCTYADTFWDGTIIGFTVDDTGNQGDQANITEKTTAQMYGEATFTNWDFTASTGVWNIDEGNAYPELQWLDIWLDYKPFQGGNGTVRLIPFEISTDESYVLEFGNEYVRFYTDSGN